MKSPDIFDESTHLSILNRIDALTEGHERRWGTMSPAQMCAHVCVSYEYAYGERSDLPPLLMRWFVRLFFRDLLIGTKPYAQGSPTAPSMVIDDARQFDVEQRRLRSYVERVYADGSAAFDGRPQVSLGPLTAQEWSTLLYKHLDHHLRQFGV
jgi:hypothetical protein